MDRSVEEERSFNGNVSVTTSLNTPAEQDVRVLATVYTIYKIGEFYSVPDVLFSKIKSHYHIFCLNFVKPRRIEF